LAPHRRVSRNVHEVHALLDNTGRRCRWYRDTVWFRLILDKDAIHCVYFDL